MLDVWNLEAGDKVERMPDGRLGTVVEWETTSTLLACGCCHDIGPNMVLLTWDSNAEEDWVDSEELRLK